MIMKEANVATCIKAFDTVELTPGNVLEWVSKWTAAAINFLDH